jgi:2-desacetyl-2-hydroxyethyl bacteriochlorophyllide A dehydrogenase
MPDSVACGGGEGKNLDRYERSLFHAMKALFLEKPGALAWSDLPEPVPAEGEALVRVRRCGVCGTDIHALAGKQPFFHYPRRLGHELCVEVVSAPTGSGLAPGNLCAVEAYYFCGSCPACRAGKTNCCKNLQVLGVHIDGGHAQFMAVPSDKLHRAPSLQPEQIALVEPLVIGAHGVERAAIKSGEPTAIIGLGPIGLAAAIFAKAAGAKVVCVDTQLDRLNFACDRMGLGTPLHADGDLAGRLQEFLGQLPSVVVDATGSSSSMKETFQLVEHGGRIVFLGLFSGEVTFDDPNFHRRELTLMASRAGLTGTFREVIRLLQAGEVDVRPLITHRFAFADAAERLPAIHREPGLVKAMINFDEIA